jgi:tetratricopeptide (TPR) repeat protein
MNDKKYFWLICFFLAVVTLAVFVPVVNYDFVNYDDPHYVTGNQTVQRGITWEGIVWAFQTGHTGNWHPVTWISHMLDCQFYGISAAGHHFTNLLFHIANTLLLFFLLTSGTRAMWRSMVAAALFALHPLHIESVAWVSERKDVLSTFFMLLAIITYFRYARNRATSAGASETLKPLLFSRDYLLVLLFFSLGLMSKPMLVTLPFILLLLDFWPLQRISFFSFNWNYFSRLLFEKIPFFVLTAASSVVTFFVQKKGGSVWSLTGFSLFDRIANVLVSYVKYLALMIWPTKLAVLYPLRAWAAWQVIMAGLLLLLISILAVRAISRRPYFALGWFWFLGTLVPVIGLVQVGLQSMADRYSYVPSIGIFVLLIWGICDFFPASRKRLLRVVGATAISLCALLTSLQLPHWQNSVALFERAIAVTEQNYVAHNNLGEALDAIGQADKAIAHYQEAIRLKPSYAQAFYNVGNVLLNKGKNEEAIRNYSEAVRLKLDFGIAHLSLGIELARQGKMNDAIEHYRIALQSFPKDWRTHYNLANALFKIGATGEAIIHYEAALKADPKDPQAHNNLANAFQQKGETPKAMEHFEEAIRLRPNYPEAHFNLALILIQQGKAPEAIGHLQEVLRSQPENDQAHYQLGTLCRHPRLHGCQVGRRQGAAHGLARREAEAAVRREDQDRQLHPPVRRLTGRFPRPRRRVGSSRVWLDRPRLTCRIGTIDSNRNLCGISTRARLGPPECSGRDPILIS